MMFNLPDRTKSNVLVDNYQRKQKKNNVKVRIRSSVCASARAGGLYSVSRAYQRADRH